MLQSRWVLYFFFTALFGTNFSISGGLNAQSRDSISLEQFQGTLLRGKILGGFLFEDLWWFNTTIGIEKNLSRRVSLGLDFIYLLESEERDLYDTITNMELGHGFSQCRRNFTLLTDQRFLINRKNAKNIGFGFYIASYLRFTRSKLNTEEGFEFTTGDYLIRSGYYFDPGISLGIKSIGQVQKEFGVDFNLGLSGRFKMEDYDRYTEQFKIESFRNKKSFALIPSIRFNLYYVINR